MRVMIQVSDIANIKDPSAAYTSCTEQTLDECIMTIERIRSGPKGYIFVRAYIQHDDKTESHHCER